MLNKILSLEGAEKLTKDQLKSIVGGLKKCCTDNVYVCTANQCCAGGTCSGYCFTLGSPECG